MGKLDELNKLLDEMLKRAEEIINTPDTEGTFEIKQTTLSTDMAGVEAVVAIGYGLAPDGLENKCLVLSHRYDWKVMDKDGYTILVPRKKNE